MITRLLGCVLLVLANQLLLGEELVGLADLQNGSQSLITFDSATPGTVNSTAITGLASGNQLLAIDFRPLTGQLYALGSDSAIYTLNRTTGVASKVGSGFTNALNGGNFGFDFNPTIDRIRIVSDADQNFVANPITGDANVAVTTPVFYAAGDINNGKQPNVVHHAYDNNLLGMLSPNPPGSQLRAIDTQLDILVAQANNAGTLTTIGPLGVNATDIGGFDVSTSGIAYAVFSNGVGATDSSLYTISLQTGAATKIGEIPFTVWGLAATPVPEPAVGALVLGLAAALMRRKSRA